jgi:nicotinate (nicotinamide) nucleotide adenylyltransferase
MAHLFTVTYLLTRDDVDQVWLMPTARHVFGKKMTPFEARVSMLQAALGAFDPARVRIVDVERDRPGQSRTYDTLDHLSDAHPDHAFMLVVGADNLTESHPWHRFDELVERWPLIAMGRPGHEAALARFGDAPWCRRGPTLPDISSTAIRDAMRGAGESTLSVPAVIHDLVRQHYADPATPPAGVGAVQIFGAGRAGRAFARALRAASVPIAGVWNRSPSNAATWSGGPPTVAPGAEVLLICVDDNAIESVAGQIAAGLDAAGDRVALHCAGRHGAEVLSALAARGVPTGSLHPLQSLADPSRAPEAFRQAWCAVEGVPQAVAAGRRLAEALGARVAEVPAGEKPSWHAAAVVAGNFLTTLSAEATRILGAIGIEPEEARALLTPLQAGSVSALLDAPAAEALTGPFARGDLDAVRAHLGALRRNAPDAVDLYGSAARATARLAGWDDSARAALDGLLSAPPDG